MQHIERELNPAAGSGTSLAEAIAATGPVKLPKKNGWDVLADAKQDELLRRTPVVILTTSRADEDVVRAYDMHANALIRKPVKMEEFLSVVRDNARYWLSIVKLPEPQGGDWDE